MAEALFKLPIELNLTEGNISENFKKVYLAASGYGGKPAETQVAIILHCAGPKLIDISPIFME